MKIVTVACSVLGRFLHSKECVKSTAVKLVRSILVIKAFGLNIAQCTSSPSKNSCQWPS